VNTYLVILFVWHRQLVSTSVQSQDPMPLALRERVAENMNYGYKTISPNQPEMSSLVY
jgi:hypothetical protein